VNIELYQTFVSHFQEKDLAGFLIHDVGAFHDLIDFEWRLAERVQDILSVIQHDWTQTVADRAGRQIGFDGLGGHGQVWSGFALKPQASGTEILDAETGAQGPPYGPAETVAKY
jgi:hypothetical protein